MISPATFDFLALLKENNSKEWMDEHRSQYRDMKSDVLAFAGLLVDEISNFDPAIAENPMPPEKCVTRLNRDMRFGKGKGPYKTDYYIVIGLQGIQGLAASYAVHIEPGNCFAGGGAPNPMGPDLQMYRQKVADGFSGFSEIITDTSFTDLFPNGITSQSGVVKKRVPRTFSPEDPAADFLKKEGFITREKLADHDLIEPAGLPKVLDLLEGSKPLIDFLNG